MALARGLVQDTWARADKEKQRGFLSCDARACTAHGFGCVRSYQIVDFCLEPKTWQVEEEVVNKKGDIVKSFVNTKLMTRETYTLDGMSGPVTIADGKVSAGRGVRGGRAGAKRTGRRA